MECRPALVALFALLSACKRDPPQPGQWIPCSCPYLTDYDDRATHKVEVCLPNPSSAKKFAAECAARHQPAHYDPCECGPALGACDGTQTCKSLETR